MGRPALDLTTLTTEEKVDLIEELWCELAKEPVVVSDALRAELDRRFAAAAADPSTLTPWQVVRARLPVRR